LRFQHFDNPLRRARLRAGLTLRELGRRTKIHYSQLSRIENGLAVRPDELARLSGVLGVAARELQTGKLARRAG
jgi:transcriptional regulator with XRE-family HTH domain